MPHEGVLRELSASGSWVKGDEAASRLVVGSYVRTSSWKSMARSSFSVAAQAFSSGKEMIEVLESLPQRGRRMVCGTCSCV